jgi:hypothetical protein
MTESLRLRPGALEWREIDGEIVALDVRRSVYLAVNESGAILWPALAEGATEDDLTGRLQEAFDLDADRARQDLDAFVAMLREHDLLDADEDAQTA